MESVLREKDARSMGERSAMAADLELKAVQSSQPAPWQRKIGNGKNLNATSTRRDRGFADIQCRRRDKRRPVAIRTRVGRQSTRRVFIVMSAMDCRVV